MGCTTEEECRRQKIIADASVIKKAADDMAAAQRGDLSVPEMRALIDLDGEWEVRRAEILSGRRAG